MLTNDWAIVAVIDTTASGNNDTSKSMSWKVLKTALSHHKGTASWAAHVQDCFFQIGLNVLSRGDIT